MTEPVFPLITLFEEQRVLTFERFIIIRPALEDGVSQTQAARTSDFTDQEAVATIIRIIQGNLRLIDRLMKQVERILIANQLTVVTNEVVETARQNLIIGFE